MVFKTIILEKKKRTGIITLNRPDRMNTINIQLMHDMDRVMEEISADDEIRSIIITGVGSAFCAGADLEDLANFVALRKNPPRYSFFNAVEDCPKPVIAAINGHCIGGGLELALCCDFRIASPDARIGLSEVRLGIIPLAGGTIRLPRLIGASLAKQVLYSGKLLSGTEAEKMGVVDKVSESESLMDESMEFMQMFEKSAPLSITTIKTLVNQGQQMDLMGALDFERKCGEVLLHTQDYQEGIMAFIEKRIPRFTNK